MKTSNLAEDLAIRMRRAAADYPTPVTQTSVCIVDDTGWIVRELSVASDPEALLQALGNPISRVKRIGLEAGPLSPDEQ